LHELIEGVIVLRSFAYLSALIAVGYLSFSTVTANEIPDKQLSEIREECFAANDDFVIKRNIEILSNYLVKSDSNKIRFVRVGCYQAISNYQAAIDDLSAMINSGEEPMNLFMLYYLRGSTYREYGKMSEAISDLSKSLGLDNTNLDAYISRAEVFVEFKKYDSSIKDYESALGLFKSRRNCEIGRECAGDSYAYRESSVYLALLNIYKHTGNKDEFESLLKEALRRNPGYEELKSMKWAE
jgi:tetratricopeptide (TPR) repeat protein